MAEMHDVLQHLEALEASAYDHPRFSYDVLPLLLRAKLRYEAGLISALEAAIEQMEALFVISPHPAGARLVDALKAFNDGNTTKLDLMILPGANECQGC